MIPLSSFKKKKNWSKYSSFGKFWWEISFYSSLSMVDWGEKEKKEEKNEKKSKKYERKFSPSKIQNF